MNKNFEISVIIPAYNRADLLPRTIQSVIDQTFKSLEIIIVDDESPDETASVCTGLIKKYQDVLPIHYIRHEKNKGEGGSRNTGMQHASGNYFAFLDSDDEWLPDKLAQQVDYLQKNNVEGVFCESFLVETGGYAAAVHTKIDHDFIVPVHILTRGCGYGVGTNLLISKQAVSGYIFDEAMRLFIDVDWLYKVSQSARIDIMHMPLTYYHKAPMRAGDYIKACAKVFMEKYAEHLKNLPIWTRLQVYACMNWYIAHAYRGNHHYSAAAKHFLWGIIQSPWRHPGHYLEPFFCLWQGMTEKRLSL